MNCLQMITYIYEYDGQHNWINKMTTIDGKAVNILQREIGYFK